MVEVLDKTRPGKKGVEVECLQCGVPMLVEPSRLRDGRGKFCSRKCSNVYMNTISHPQSGSDNNNWRQGISEDKMRYKRIQKERYPERVRARKLLKEAVDAGRMQRGPCEVCGTTENVHGHHDDYSKPYDVRWLCEDHHRDHHKKGED